MSEGGKKYDYDAQNVEMYNIVDLALKMAINRREANTSEIAYYEKIKADLEEGRVT